MLERKDLPPRPRPRPRRALERESYSSSSASSTVARGGRCDTVPAAGAASEPVGCGAESASTGAGAGVGSAWASGWGVAVPEAFFFPFEALPLRGVPAALAASLAAFFSFFARFLFLMSSGVCGVLDMIVLRERGVSMSYLLPCPHGSERVEEADVLEEIGVQPETRWRREHGDDEEDQSEDCHGEE